MRTDKCCGTHPVDGEAQPDSSKHRSQACSMKGDDDPSGARKESQSLAGMDVMDECSSNSKSYPRMFLVVLVLALPMLLDDEDDGVEAYNMGPFRCWQLLALIFDLGRIRINDKSDLSAACSM